MVLRPTVFPVDLKVSNTCAEITLALSLCVSGVKDLAPRILSCLKMEVTPKSQSRPSLHRLCFLSPVEFLASDAVCRAFFAQGLIDCFLRLSLGQPEGQISAPNNNGESAVCSQDSLFKTCALKAGLHPDFIRSSTPLCSPLTSPIQLGVHSQY